MIVREKLSLVLGWTYAAAAANASATSASSRKPRSWTRPDRSAGCPAGLTPIVTRSNGSAYCRIAKWNAASSQSQPLPRSRRPANRMNGRVEAMAGEESLGVVARRDVRPPRRSRRARGSGAMSCASWCSGSDRNHRPRHVGEHRAEHLESCVRLVVQARHDDRALGYDRRAGDRCPEEVRRQDHRVVAVGVDDEVVEQARARGTGRRARRADRRATRARRPGCAPRCARADGAAWRPPRGSGARPHRRRASSCPARYSLRQV